MEGWSAVTNIEVITRDSAVASGHWNHGAPTALRPPAFRALHKDRSGMTAFRGMKPTQQLGKE